MRRWHTPTLLALCLAAAFTATPSFSRTCRGTACGKELVYFGTHGDQPGQEMFGAWFDETTGDLTPLGSVADVYRATWLTADPDRDVLYSVSEAGNDGKSNGRVLSFKVDRATGKLTQLSNVDAGGGGTTHLDYDARSHSLFAANFGSGTVSVLPVDKAGRIGPVASLGHDYGTGPNRRQSGPHAHAVTVAPAGNFVLVPDLGADRTFVYRFDPKNRALAPAVPPFAQVPPETGPRHIVFGRNGRFAYLATELNAQVIVYRWNPAGTLTPLQTVDLMPAGFIGQRSAAEIAVSNDGRFLYISSREGENAIYAFAIDKRTGKLTRVQRIETGIRPWSFALSPRQKWMLVAEEGVSAVSILARDPATGKLTDTGKSLPVFKPVNVTFVR